MINARINGKLSAMALAVVAVCTAGSVEGATWTGAGGDHLWSTKENWSDNAVPGKGDTAIFSSADSLFVTNDVDGLVLGKLTFDNSVGSAPVTLCGKPITLENGSPWENHVVVTNATSITVTHSSPQFKIYNGFSMMSNITATTTSGIVTFGLGNSGNSTYVNTRNSDWHFWGAVDARGATQVRVRIGGQVFMNQIHFHGPVFAKKLINDAYTYSRPTFYAGESVPLVQCSYGGIDAGAKNGFPTNMVISWPSHYETWNGSTRFLLNGFDQTIDRLEGGEFKRSNGNECGIDTIYSSAKAVLTLRGTQDARTEGRIDNNVEIVWDPVGDYTQTFANRTAATAEPITVRRGTVKLEGHGSFANVKTINISSNAVFECASTNAASPLAALKNVNVASGGVFRVSRSAEEPVLRCPSAWLKLDADAKVEIAERTEVEVQMVDCRGVYLAPTTYTAANCDWIEGNGSLRVVDTAAITCWDGPTDGDGSQTARWTRGTPVSGDVEAYVVAHGANYDVAFDVPQFVPSKVYVGNDAGHAARLLVSGDTSLASDGSTAFEVTDGGVVEFASGLSSFTNTNTSATIATVSGSGVWRVSGGTNTMYFYNKGLVLKNGGTLQVTAGLFQAQNTRYTYTNPFGMENGNLEVSGTGSFRAVNLEGEFNPMGSGSITATDDATVYFGRAYAGPNVAGVPLCITLRNRASFSGLSAAFFGDTLTGGETYIKLYDNARWAFG